MVKALYFSHNGLLVANDPFGSPLCGQRRDWCVSPPAGIRLNPNPQRYQQGTRHARHTLWEICLIFNDIWYLIQQYSSPHATFTSRLHAIFFNSRWPNIPTHTRCQVWRPFCRFTILAYGAYVGRILLLWPVQFYPPCTILLLMFQLCHRRFG